MAKFMFEINDDHNFLCDLNLALKCQMMSSNLLCFAIQDPLSISVQTYRSLFNDQTDGRSLFCLMFDDIS